MQRRRDRRYVRDSERSRAAHCGLCRGGGADRRARALRHHPLDLVSHNCTYGEDDEAFDSWAISAYERAIIALEKAGYVAIDDVAGRIAGKLTEQGRMFDAWMALHARRKDIADARQHLATVPGATERREAVARLYDINVADLDDRP